MAPRPLSDEDLIKTVAAHQVHRTQRATAEALGIVQSQVSERLKAAAERGLMLDHPPAMPGYQIKSVASQVDGKWVKQTKEPGEKWSMPTGQTLKGVSAYTDAEGRITHQWFKTKEGVLDPMQVAEWLKEAFADFQPAATPVPVMETSNEDLLTLIPCNDWHVGMFVWGKEADVNWDLKIAENVIGQTVEDVIARTSPSEEAIVLGGGDLMHADNRANQTANGTPQDVDGRYQKVLTVAQRLMVRTVDATLRRHKHVTVRILRGNHDEHASVAVAHFLKAWYRNEPRVTVDVDPSLYFWFRFGQVMIGATHGHEVKIQAMPGIMAHRRAEDWGKSKHRYVHGFHLHHSAKFATEGNGVISEIHQAPIPHDAWHYGKGYCSGRSIQAITYHRDSGEKGRVREALLDAV